ncbi:VCBS repeat-containing protein [Paenibacillus humicus]
MTMRLKYNRRKSGPARRPSLKRRTACLAAAACLVLLAGCRYTAAPADLLTAPEAAQPSGKLSQEVRALLPPGSSLALPQREKQPEAIRTLDLDGDGKPEALVSYTDGYGGCQLLIAKEEPSGWKKWATIRSAASTSLDWLSIVDLDGDKRPELVAGWAVSVPGDSTAGQQYMLQVYSFLNPQFEEGDSGLVLKPLAELAYETAETGDVDGDGMPEISLVNRNKKGTIPTLRVYRLAEGRLTEAASLPLYPDVNLYDRITAGKVSKERYGLIAEAGVGAHSSMSAMFMWNKGALEQVYPPYGNPDLGFSPSGVMNGDINGDGILEWSRLTEAAGQKQDTPYADMLFYTEWMQWNGLLPGEEKYDAREPFAPVSIEYNSYPYGLSLQIPSRWRGQFTLTRPEDIASGIVTVNYYNAKSGRIAPLWTICAVPVKEWDGWSAGLGAPRKKVVNLRTAGGFVYAAVQEPDPDGKWPEAELNQYRSMRLTDEQLASSVRLLPEN